MDKPSFGEYFVPLCPSCNYHVFNRTNNRELLFRSDENRRYFLKKIGEYLSPVLDIYAYCLLPNHFHLMVQIKSRRDIENWVNLIPEDLRNSAQRHLLATDAQDKNAVPDVVERQFQRLFISYAKAFNQMWNRNGHLFQRPFKRLEVFDDNHFIALICYIHRNPIKHGISATFTDYYWSSYRAFLSEEPTKIAREKALEFFGSLDSFITFHEGEQAVEGFDKLIIE